MELTREEAEKMIAARFTETPKMGAVVHDVSFQKKLSEILSFEETDLSLLPIIENEVKVVLAFYAPQSTLGANIAESTGLPLEKAEHIALLIDTVLFDDVRTELANFETHIRSEIEKNERIPEADKNIKEELELRPQETPAHASAGVEVGSGVRPLTRADVLRSVAPSRTMTKDIATITEKAALQTPTPPPSSPIITGAETK